MIRIRNIKVDITTNNLEKRIAKLLTTNTFNYKIVKKSIDARHKNDIKYIYTVDVDVDINQVKRKSEDITLTPHEEYIYEVCGNTKLGNRPIVVGMGPAGLFTAYLLSLNGFNPIVIDRGEEVEKRVKTIEEFWENNELNENSNVQFGEGGAGTFSDGKLNTLVNDKEFRKKFILETFVKFGANEDILYDSHPHIGTDVLRKVVKNMRLAMIDIGAEFRFNTLLTNINVSDNKITSIEVNNKEIIPTDVLFLHIGHSARDTFKMLECVGIKMMPKPFAVGVRVIHNEEDISKAMYGDAYKYLEPASYKLTYTTKDGRGVYSFCMCPGGYVVNASSEKGRLAINGMSNNKRDSGASNSAVVVTVDKRDFGENLFGGLEFQRKLEKVAFIHGKGLIPLQRYEDFVNNEVSTRIGRINAITKGKFTFANLNQVLPSFISNSIKEAMPYFNTKIKGYSDPDTLMLAIESRTSSPIKMERNEALISNIDGIFVGGEGAGYAGGITTAAMDGLKCAESFLKIYKKN